MWKQAFIPIIIVAVLATMILPVPPLLMDFLIVSNLLLAVVLLINTLYVADPLKLSSLPTMLLLATLFRLALNISTTRLILGNGDAGKTVEAFGSIVIQGNLIVGAVIFLIITLVQFIVVAKGSERVAEVSARFSLDAMPGKQMSIDADVRAGLLDFEAARQKRQDLQIESRFYGSLDGAMKFVKGDAIAGIVICLINIAGGLCIGMLVNGMDIHAALSKYTILTVGDGLAAQIPALLNSMAAGLVVTRVVRGDNVPLSTEVLAQFGQIKEVKFFICAICVTALFVPGIPVWPPLLAGLLCAAALLKKSNKPKVQEKNPAIFLPRTPPLLQINLTKDCARMLTSVSALSERVDLFRQKVYEKSGLVLLRPDLAALEGNGLQFEIRLRGVVLYKENLLKDKCANGDFLIDHILAQLFNIVNRHGSELVDDILTRRTLDYFDKEAPELVSAVIPTIVSITQLTYIFKALLTEQVTIKNTDLILQALADIGSKAENERHMLEEVRIALKHVICEGFSNNHLRAISLDPLIDLSMARCEKSRNAADPESIILIENSLKTFDAEAVLVVSRAARKLIKEYLTAAGISRVVLAFEELVPSLNIKWMGNIEAKDEIFQERVMQQIAA